MSRPRYYDQFQVSWRAKELDLTTPTPGHDIMEPELHRIQSAGRFSRLHQLPPGPTPDLRADHELHRHEYVGLRDKRILMVGAGAGAIALRAYLSMRGIQPAAMTFLDPQGPGGIGNHDWVRTGGFNNPASLAFNQAHRLDISDRRGVHMQRFLHDIFDDYLWQAAFIEERVVDLGRKPRENHWTARTASGKTLQADYAVVATGRPKARPIDSPRIESNLDKAAAKMSQEELIVEHYQRELTQEELGSGRSIILIGLGNSTAAMLHKIQTYEDEHGVELNYRVVTDLPSPAVMYPDQSFYHDRQPLFRNPENGYLTGYSGDLPRDRRSFYRALYENRIITEAQKVWFDTDANCLKIDGESGTEGFVAPHVFTLIGYDTDNRLLLAANRISIVKKILKRAETPPIRPADGSVGTRAHGHLSNLFAIGSCAANRCNPNAAVLPGIFGQVPATALTIGMRAQSF